MPRPAHATGAARRFPGQARAAPGRGRPLRREAIARRKKRAAFAALFASYGGCGAYFFSPASLRRSSALSVFSHEKAVAVCFLPAPST